MIINKKVALMSAVCVGQLQAIVSQLHRRLWAETVKIVNETN